MLLITHTFLDLEIQIIGIEKYPQNVDITFKSARVRVLT